MVFLRTTVLVHPMPNCRLNLATLGSFLLLNQPMFAPLRWSARRAGARRPGLGLLRGGKDQPWRHAWEDKVQGMLLARRVTVGDAVRRGAPVACY